MNWYIQHYLPDSYGNRWVGWYLDPRTKKWDFAGPYLTAKAATVVAKWQAHK